MLEKFGKLSKLKKLLIVILAFIVFVSCFNLCTDVIFVDRTGDPSAKTNTEPAVYDTSNELLQELKRYGAYKDLSNVLDQDIYKSMFVIPGLNGTKTLNLYCGETDLCEDMVPQALAVTKNNIFFTMYCHKGEHNSVLMMLDKTTGKFLKEVPLRGKDHVGGMAFDSNHGILWVSGKKNSVPVANGIRLLDVLNYDSDAMEEPVKYTYVAKLEGLPSNSFMTYKDDKIFAGCFSLRGNGKIRAYQINEEGDIVTSIDDLSITNTIERLISSSFSGISDKFALVLPRIQGISFVNDKLMMTQSFGPFDSTLMLSKDTDIINGKNKLLEKNISREMNLPPYLEYACYCEEDNKVYILFEGGANAYSWRARVPMDRIICTQIE